MENWFDIIPLHEDIRKALGPAWPRRAGGPAGLIGAFHPNETAPSPPQLLFRI